MVDNPHSKHVYVVCGPSMMCATALLNPNAFPNYMEKEANVVARRFAIVLHNIDSLSINIDKATENFYTDLKRNWQMYIQACNRKPDIESIAEHLGLEYLSSMHSFLYELKAFLDVYAKLICMLISNTEETKTKLTFSKANIEGTPLSGGKLVRWINNCSLKTVPKQRKLTKQIISSSKEWITPAVKLRDDIAHYRELPGLQHMCVSVTNGPTKISMSDISQPKMKNGQALDEYARSLSINLGQFVTRTLLLLPHVQTQLLEPWDRAAAKYLGK